MDFALDVTVWGEAVTCAFLCAWVGNPFLDCCLIVTADVDGCVAFADVMMVTHQADACEKTSKAKHF